MGNVKVSLVALAIGPKVHPPIAERDKGDIATALVLDDEGAVRLTSKLSAVVILTSLIWMLACWTFSHFTSIFAEASRRSTKRVLNYRVHKIDAILQPRSPVY